jgi:hypothetical protein
MPDTKKCKLPVFNGIICRYNSFGFQSTGFAPPAYPSPAETSICKTRWPTNHDHRKYLCYIRSNVFSTDEVIPPAGNDHCRELSSSTKTVRITDSTSILLSNRSAWNRVRARP